MCSNVYVSFKIAFGVSKFLHICCSVDWIINIYQCKFKFCVAIVLLPSENKLGLWIVPYKNTIISCISFKWFREESQKVRSAVMLILWSHAEILEIAPLTAAKHFYVTSFYCIEGNHAGAISHFMQRCPGCELHLYCPIQHTQLSDTVGICWLGWMFSVNYNRSVLVEKVNIEWI